MKLELSDGEWVLMRRLWEEAPRTITQLTAALKEEAGWSKHTIISMLSRLEAKARNDNRSNSLVVKFFSSPLTQTRRAVLSIFNPRISITSFPGLPLPISRSYRARWAFTRATISLGLKGLIM